MDTLKERRARPPEPDGGDDRPGAPSALEASYWLAEFRDVAESDEARQAFARDPIFPTDDEIARIEREVEEEFRGR